MLLIIGAVSLALAVFLYNIVMRGINNQEQPKWASDNMCSMVHCVLIAAFGGAGALIVGSALYTLAVKHTLI